MAYLPTYPKLAAFFCQQAAETGGSTTICDMRRFHQRVPSETLSKLKERGVRYVYNYRDPDHGTGIETEDLWHRTWPDAFGTDDKAEVEAIIRGKGLEFEWLKDGSISTIYNAPGVIAHPQSGEEIFFNSVPALTVSSSNVDPEAIRQQEEAYKTNGLEARAITLTHADGSEIDAESIEELFDIFDELEVAFPWHNGDIMIVDNISVAHGRDRFTGKRNIQVALLK